MKRNTFVLTAAFAAVAALQSAAVAQYTKLLDFSYMHVGSQYNILGAHCFDGTTAYCIPRGIETVITPYWEGQVTKVENFTTSPTTTLLVDYATWVAHTGIVPEDGDNILPGNRMIVVDGFLQFLDVGTDAIYRVDTSTGALSTLVSNADILAHTGLTAATTIDAVAVKPCGEMAFYEQRSDTIILIAPDGTLTTLLGPADFSTVYGPTTPPSNYNYVAGGMSYDDAGNLYWTLSNTGSTSGGGTIYRWNEADGSIDEVVTQADLVTFTDSVFVQAFNDIYVGPDRIVYFFDRASDVNSILYFDPADPVNTLGTYLSQSDLDSGPAGSHYVGALASYEEDLAWNHSLTATSPHIYNKALVGTPTVPLDYDGDGDTDLSDYGTFLGCYNGPGNPPAAAGCAASDTDCDGDVDLSDYGAFLDCYNGPNNPPACL